MLTLRLLVVGGELEANEVSLPLPAMIGRGRDVAVNLTHPLVSRRHCELVEKDGHVLVRDLQSLNGTFVGSDRIEEAILWPGDLLTVGTVTFRAMYCLPEHARQLPRDLAVKPSAGMAETVRRLDETFRVSLSAEDLSLRAIEADAEPSR